MCLIVQEHWTIELYSYFIRICTKESRFKQVNVSAGARTTRLRNSCDMEATKEGVATLMMSLPPSPAISVLPELSATSCTTPTHKHKHITHVLQVLHMCGKLYRNTHKLTLKIYKSLLLPTLHGKNVQTSWKGFSSQISILLATHTCLDISDAALYFCSGISPTSTPHWLTL